MSAPFLTIKEERRTRKSTQTRRAKAGRSPRRDMPAGRVTQARVVANQRPAKRKSRASTAEIFVTNCVLFAAIAPLTWGFSLLLGNSFKENARRSAVSAAMRAKSARQDMARLTNRLDRLTSAQAVNDWALTRGFVPAHGLPQEEKVVP